MRLLRDKNATLIVVIVATLLGRKVAFKSLLRCYIPINPETSKLDKYTKC